MNNTFTSGDYFGSATFGAFTISSIGIRDFYLAKYDDSGDCICVQSAGGSNASIKVTSITTDG